ncbi:MAG: hypothetical protein PHZ24_06580 [Bacteroidales bacterium]|nr:hypothetical protein [Bacteroidales bacterium]
MNKNDSNKNFIIFTFQRTGSSTLSDILDLHPDINVSFEPFLRHKTLISGGYHYKVKNDQTLNNTLKEIFSQCTGIKHISSQLDETYNKGMLKANYKIIFLWRKNYLQKTISHQISSKTQAWFKDRNKIHKTKFDPISLDSTDNSLKLYKDQVNKYYTFLKNNNTDFFHLTYEELYSPDLSLSQKSKKINDIIKYLGYDKITDQKVIKQIEILLNPKKSKLNNLSTYFRIPNILEIEKKFGSEENGHLFQLNFLQIFYYKLAASTTNLFYRIDYAAGSLGLFLQKHIPFLYRFLKKIKNN